MAMTPREARTVTFTEDRRGYAPTEVHEYQERVAEALRMYETEVGRLRSRLEQSEERITELQDAEDAVRRTFVAAAQTKREMVAEAEAEAERVRREADEAATRQRATTDEETSRQRAAAQAEATRLVDEARIEAHETRAKAETEVRLLERRLLQLRTSISDLEVRLSDFAGRALDELAVAGSMIDLETADLTDIEALAPQAAAVAEPPAPAADEPATGEPARADEDEDEPQEAVPAAAAAPVAAEAAPAEAAEPEVELPVPAPAPAVAAPTEPASAGPAVGIPVGRGAAPADLDEDQPDGSFYERRLAGLRRRIESASDD